MAETNASSSDPSQKIVLQPAQHREIRELVKKRLAEVSDHTDGVLSEYVMVMVGNGRQQNQVAQELDAFLGAQQANAFATWLWDVLPEGRTQPPPTYHFDGEDDENVDITSTEESTLNDASTTQLTSEIQVRKRQREAPEEVQQEEEEEEEEVVQRPRALPSVIGEVRGGVASSSAVTRGRGERRFRSSSSSVPSLTSSRPTLKQNTGLAPARLMRSALQTAASSVLQNNHQQQQHERQNTSRKRKTSITEKEQENEEHVTNEGEVVRRVAVGGGHNRRPPVNVVITLTGRSQLGALTRPRRNGDETNQSPEKRLRRTIREEGEEVAPNETAQEEQEAEEEAGSRGQATKIASQKVKRCTYWPACTKGDECQYFHPTEICKAWPKCTFGANCLYIHPTTPCKYGSRCTRPNCAFVHDRSSTSSLHSPYYAPPPVVILKSTTPPPCRFGFTCTVKGCKYSHPMGPCKFGKQCTKGPLCPYSHAPPCKHGAKCKKPGCKFAHNATNVSWSVFQARSAASVPALDAETISKFQQRNQQDNIPSEEPPQQTQEEDDDEATVV
ncbi:putative 2-ketogluconate transporter [Balamuthia mandrillaris]